MMYFGLCNVMYSGNWAMSLTKPLTKIEKNGAWPYNQIFMEL